MHECPFQIISSIASNTTLSWECIAVTLLSTYTGTQRALTVQSASFFFFFLTFGGRRFSFIVSCRPSSVNSVLVGNVFVFPITAPGWPYRNGSHHNKALWIISLGQPILPGSTLLSSTPPAPAKSQWTVCNSAKLNQLKLMQILLFEGKRLDVSRYGGLHLRQTAEQEKGSQISSVTGTTSGDIYGGLSQICNHPVL